MPRKSSSILPFASPSADRLRPPPDLDDDPDAKALFIDIVLSVRADFFEPSDAAVLATYARAVCLERKASAELKADGYVLRDGKVSPWLAILQASTRTISVYARLLKLNPAGRHSTPAPSSERQPMSYYDRMRLEHRDDEPGH